MAADRPEAAPARRAVPAILRLAVFCGLGVLAALGQVPWGVWPLALVAFGAAMAHAPAGRGAAFAAGWAMGAGHFAFALQWLVEPFQVEAEVFGWMAPFALALMAAGLALFWGAAFALARWIAGPNGAGRFAFAAALALTGVEIARGRVLTGFPWAMPGHVWLGTPLEQLAAFGGAALMTLVALGLAACVAMAITGGAGRLMMLVPAGLLPALWVVLPPGPAPQAGGPLVRLVQPAIAQAEKFDATLAPGHFERLLELTAEGAPAALTVWPETALPWFLNYADEIAPLITEAAQGGPVILGAARQDEATGRYHNSLALVEAGALGAVYDKVHLVPFGEYMPAVGLVSRLGIRALAVWEDGGYSPGPGPALIEVPGIGPVLPLICYEGIFAPQVNAAPGRARVIVLITNDAWFGTRSGPFQHFDLGRLRAIEQGLPMIRVANTGVSGVIDGKGRVLGTIPLGPSGTLALPLPPALDPPPFVHWGEAPVILIVLLGLFLLRGRRGIGG